MDSIWARYRFRTGAKASQRTLAATSQISLNGTTLECSSGHHLAMGLSSNLNHQKVEGLEGLPLREPTHSRRKLTVPLFYKLSEKAAFS